MFLVALIGVCLNISSVVYFAQLKTQSAFHRSIMQSLFGFYEGPLALTPTPSKDTDGIYELPLIQLILPYRISCINRGLLPMSY